ncbi:MAG: 4-diphosphocytidyl-2C-methyl-D-erythritol synthase [Symbiobacteriaceae bacterium]|nr:4-diphosphocytidyl-2C-methyl-D-erythritol synthase [Symbiobacteriaceae bacterium]
MIPLEFGIILLAAGASRRMGDEHKLLLPWGAGTVIGQSVRTAAAVDGAHLVIVLGCRAPEVRDAAEAALNSNSTPTWVINRGWQEGMFTSIQTGLAHLPDSATAFFVALGDMPMIPAQAYRTLIDAYKAQPDRIYVPTYEGRRGHPVLVPRRVVTDTPPPDTDQGLRSVLRQYPELVVEVPVPYQGVCIDLDTPDEYRRYV